MKIRNALYASAVVLSYAIPVWADPPTDAEAKTKLIGSWEAEANGLKGTDVFKEDGTFIGTASGLVGGMQVSIAVEGKWSIKEGVLAETVTKTNHPELVPVGAVTHDRLIEVTDKTFKARTESGSLEVHVKS